MDLIEGVPKNQGFKVEFESLEFDALTSTLHAYGYRNRWYECDAWACLRKVAFSDRHYKAGTVFARKKR